jgi:hypothetical protein
MGKHLLVQLLTDHSNLRNYLVVQNVLQSKGISDTDPAENSWLAVVMATVTGRSVVYSVECTGNTGFCHL